MTLGATPRDYLLNWKGANAMNHRQATLILRLNDFTGKLDDGYVMYVRGGKGDTMTPAAALAYWMAHLYIAVEVLRT